MTVFDRLRQLGYLNDDGLIEMPAEVVGALFDVAEAAANARVILWPDITPVTEPWASLCEALATLERAVKEQP